VLGSVATRTLQQAAMPLMVVRASPAETTQPMEASESVAAH
jgi:hypothetical protein